MIKYGPTKIDDSSLQTDTLDFMNCDRSCQHNGKLVTLKLVTTTLAFESGSGGRDGGWQVSRVVSGPPANASIIKQYFDAAWLLIRLLLSSGPLKVDNGAHSTINQSIMGGYVASQHNPSPLCHLCHQHAITM